MSTFLTLVQICINGMVLKATKTRGLKCVFPGMSSCCHLANSYIRKYADEMSHQTSLAHSTWIAEILPWGRKSYLTHVILPRLSREGYTLVVLELEHMIVK